MVVAPTGVAALNAKGVTIHSFFRLPPHIVGRNNVQKLEDRSLYLALELLVIDEISMVRPDLIDAMDWFLRINRDKKEQPFGGVQLIMIGDLFQLPPIVIKQQDRTALQNMGYRSEFFFASHCLKSSELFTVELVRVFRQKDANFIELLDQIRTRRDEQNAVAVINRSCLHSTDSSELTLTCTNSHADSINRRKLAELAGHERVYLASASGEFNAQDDKLPAPARLTLKVGAHVMFTKNDPQKRWVNGTVGIVTKLDQDSIYVRIKSEPFTTFSVQRITWENLDPRFDAASSEIVSKVIGTYTQFPLMLAWAITIHKSQGKTIDKAHIDLGNGAFCPGQVYVALSRCRTLKGITLARQIESRDIKCDERVKQFYARVLPGFVRPSVVSK